MARISHQKENEIFPEKRKHRKSRLDPVKRAKMKALSHDEYMGIFQRTLQLSQAGKITSKNAWGLELNEHLQDVVDESAGGKDSMNFQTASCTLDASVKIYSVRVDSVHNQAYKVLGDFNRTAVKSEEVHEAASDADSDEEAKSKNRTRTSKLAQSFDTINAKSSEFEPLSTSSSIMSMMNSDGLFLEQFPISSRIPFSESSDVVEIPVSKLSNETSSFFGNANLFSLYPVCAELDVMYNMIKVLENQLSSVKTETTKKEFSPVKKEAMHGDYTFNPSESYAGLDDSFAGGFDDYFDHYDDDGNFDKEKRLSFHSSTGDDDGGYDVTKVMQALKVSGKAGFTWSDAKFLKSWAGKSFWKFPSRNKTGPVDAGPDKKIRKRQAAKVSYIDFNGPPVDESDLKAPARSKNLLTKAALKKMQDEKAETLLREEELQFSKEALFTLFLKRSSNIISDAKSLFYHPNGVDPESMEQNYNDDGDDDQDFHYSNNDGVHGDEFELVPKPFRPNKMEIKFARSAKKVDVRALKACIWNSLTDEEPSVKQESGVVKKEKGTDVEVLAEPERSFQTTMSSVYVMYFMIR